MPYVRHHSICKFCKHFDIESWSAGPLTCRAFPDRIPESISDLNMTYDHRIPHPDDNGIQFEMLEDEVELGRRFPRFLKDRFDEAVRQSIDNTIQVLEHRISRGFVEPHKPTPDN